MSRITNQSWPTETCFLLLPGNSCPLAFCDRHAFPRQSSASPSRSAAPQGSSLNSTKSLKQQIPRDGASKGNVPNGVPLVMKAGEKSYPKLFLLLFFCTLQRQSGPVGRLPYLPPFSRLKHYSLTTAGLASLPASYAKESIAHPL